MTRLLVAVTVATAGLAALGRILIDIAAEIDEMTSTYRVEVPTAVLERMWEA